MRSYPRVASRLAIIGLVVLLLAYCVVTRSGGPGGLMPGNAPTRTAPNGQSTLDPATERFMRGVLGSTERVWGELFQREGRQYTPTTLVAYNNGAPTGCGTAEAAMGPFYCPADKRIYVDPQFFDELATRFNAPGDFPVAYIIAHEVGHHVQDQLGVLGEADRLKAQLGEADRNRVQVGIELQADCYAGVWAKLSGGMEPGDLEEGMRAAEAAGDDTLQQQSYGRVVPDSFTHGTSADRMQAFKTGFDSGDPNACAVYTQGLNGGGTGEQTQ